MAVFILRRILYGIPIILGTTLLLFIIFNVLPGQDPALQLAGRHATPETLASIRHELGLDQSLPMQFVQLLRETVTFDFGRSWATKQRISEMLIDGIPASLSLSLPAFFIALFVSLGIAMVVAVYRGRFIDKSIVGLCVAGQSISVLVYVLYGQYFLAYKWGLFPISGYSEDWNQRWHYLLLPGLIYIVLSLAPWVRFYRTVLLDEIFQDYVRTAKAKGLSGSTIMLKHVLKNAMIPIITNLVIEIPFLILGVLLLEGFFGIPGLGDLTVRAIANNDRPVLIAVTVMGTVVFVIFNIISDVLYGVVDPRVQLK